MTETGSEQTKSVARLGSKSTSFFAEREAAQRVRKMFGALLCEQQPRQREMFSSKSTSRVLMINKCQKVSATTISKEQARSKSRLRPHQMSGTTLNIRPQVVVVGLVLFLQSVALLASCNTNNVNTQQRPLAISSEPLPRQPQQVATEPGEYN